MAAAATRKSYQGLNDEQIAHFLEHGWIRIERAFTQQQADEWMENLWDRIGMKPDDKGTWTRWRTHLSRERIVEVKDFAPKAWDAMCDLLGGAERIDPAFSTWGDSFIVNLGTEELAKAYEDARAVKKMDSFHDMHNPGDLTNWHVDGDFFVHFLDSPEQGLLVVPIFTDIEPFSGATYICPTAIPIMAKYLADHPEGVVPANCGLVSSNASYLQWSEPLATEDLPKGTPNNPRGEPQYPDPVPRPASTAHPERFDMVKQVAQAPGMKFVELTGRVGDVVLMHPLMLHSASPNWRRALRVITNPPVALKEPFCFNRTDGNDYSLVEQKTLLALDAWDAREGDGRLLGWQIKGERRRIVPLRLYS